MSALPMACGLMDAFAERTGLSSSRPPRRYLWTDAFAVCNFLRLADATGEGRYLELSLKLVGQVHHVLGFFRPDDSRRGWLSGLAGPDAERHPTRGGLRIGKPLPERGPHQPFDDRLEWERDGQYFHYLTRWMHALDRVAHVTGQPQFNAWALELMETAYAAFVDPGANRMAWKMSTDLERPLVTSMGQHDPLDGLLTVKELQATAAHFGAAPLAGEAAAGFAALTEGRDWLTTDPLGVGGLLTDAWRARRLMPGSGWSEKLLEVGLEGLRAALGSGDLEMPPSRRLGFRELGLAIGLQAAALLEPARPDRLRALAEGLVTTWSAPENQQLASWREHLDINEVMLATALQPEGYLGA